MYIYVCVCVCVCVLDYIFVCINFMSTETLWK